ncbi:MAG TPA: hypothetical protein VLG27_04810, partial [Candidatus Saccharimonadia bacterium]|nr:hypothetical protein [Candidatus Saccharimonadia bacterium]
MANFTGVLVRRQYKPGQKYIQLVFETAGGLQLSLSRNLKLVRSLSVGNTYRIEGPEYALGDKTYVHEPTALPVNVTPKSARRLNPLLVVLMALVAVGLAGAFFFMTNNTGAHKSIAEKSGASKQPEIKSVTATKQTPAAATTTPTTTQPTVQTAVAYKKTTPKSSTTSTSTTSTTSTPPATDTSGTQDQSPPPAQATDPNPPTTP